MRFEWNVEKARFNADKHGITFQMAITAFDDPFALIAPGEKHSTEAELREWLIGESDDGVLIVVFTKRERGQVYSIISARPASRRERRSYEAFKRVSF